jgi:hypothetical protein
VAVPWVEALLFAVRSATFQPAHGLEPSSFRVHFHEPPNVRTLPCNPGCRRSLHKPWPPTPKTGPPNCTNFGLPPQSGQAEGARRLPEQAFLPALKRYGIGPVGVFVENRAGCNKLYLLIVTRLPSSSPLSARLAADEEHQKAAADYLTARARPVYRVESSLLAASPGCRSWRSRTRQTPAAESPHLRSHNERAARRRSRCSTRASWPSSAALD